MLIVLVFVEIFCASKLFLALIASAIIVAKFSKFSLSLSHIDFPISDAILFTFSATCITAS